MKPSSLLQKEEKKWYSLICTVGLGPPPMYGERIHYVHLPTRSDAWQVILLAFLVSQIHSLICLLM